MTAQAMMSFIALQAGDEAARQALLVLERDTTHLLQPLVEGLLFEGSQHLKPACDSSSLINPASPTCFQGSGWVPEAQALMGGKLPDANLSLTASDQFHQWSPKEFLPTLNKTCSAGDNCTLNIVTVSTNFYQWGPGDVLGVTETGAYEINAKIMSRQSIQKAAGVQDPDFTELDMVGNRCAEINYQALQWAIGKASQKALGRYNSTGKPLVLGPDREVLIGREFGTHYLDWDVDFKNTHVTIRSPALAADIASKNKDEAGFHFCKLLSPFRALEWIYVDSLYGREKTQPVNSE